MGKRLGRAHRANAPAFTPAAWMPPRLRPPRGCPRVYARRVDAPAFTRREVHHHPTHRAAPTAPMPPRLRPGRETGTGTILLVECAS